MGNGDVENKIGLHALHVFLGNLIILLEYIIIIIMCHISYYWS